MEGENAFASAVGYLSAFLLGAAAGGVVGVLVAPASGNESRKKVRLWLKEMREHGREEILARKGRIGAAIEAGREAYQVGARVNH